MKLTADHRPFLKTPMWSCMGPAPLTSLLLGFALSHTVAPRLLKFLTKLSVIISWLYINAGIIWLDITLWTQSKTSALPSRFNREHALHSRFDRVGRRCNFLPIPLDCFLAAGTATCPPWWEWKGNRKRGWGVGDGRRQVPKRHKLNENTILGWT